MLINENISVRKAFNIMQVVSLYRATICALKEMCLQPGALCPARGSAVWYSVVTKLLSCRCSEARAILFLFLFFYLCLSTARRRFMLLTLGGLCSFVLVKGKRWIWWRLAVRGGCPFPRCRGVPVSTHCPLDQLLGCSQCCSCRGKQGCNLELQQGK